MVYKAIAAKLFPEESKLNAKAMGERVKGKIEACVVISTFRCLILTKGV